jgi:hypothetical protein
VCRDRKHRRRRFIGGRHAVCHSRGVHTVEGSGR